MKIWAKTQNGYEPFPYNKLTRFADGKLGFTYAQIIKPWKHRNLGSVNLNLWLHWRQYFDLDEINNRVVLKDDLME